MAESDTTTAPSVDSTVDHGDLPDVPEAAPVGSSNLSPSVSLEDVTEAMKDVVDPELGINVVDLGLVYGLHLDEGSNCVIDSTVLLCSSTSAP